MSALVLPASVISVRLAQWPAAWLTKSAIVVDRRADDHQLGRFHAVGHVGRTGVDGSELFGPLKPLLIAADTDHLACQLPLAHRQSDGAPNQPHADNRHGVELCHGSILGDEGRKRECLYAPIAWQCMEEESRAGGPGRVLYSPGSLSLNLSHGVCTC